MRTRYIVHLAVMLIVGLAACKANTPEPSNPASQSVVAPTQTSANSTLPASPTQPEQTETPAKLTTTPDQPLGGMQARIFDFVNEVAARPLADNDWSAAQVEQIIYQGGSVWAKESSTARLDLDEKLLRVAPNTIFTLSQPEDNKLQVNLEDGRVWMNVEGMPEGEEVEVVTPNAVASVRGTRFSVRYDPATGETTVSSMAGQVDVSRQDGTLIGSVTDGLMLTTTLLSSGLLIPLTYAENLSWGMAYGSDLGVIFPGEIPAPTRTYDFEVFDPTISGDGQKLLYTIPTDDGMSTETTLDLATGLETPAGIAPGSYGFFFAPTGQNVGYFNFPVEGGGGENICQKDFLTGDNACLPVPVGSSLASDSVQWNSTSDRVLATSLVMPSGYSPRGADSAFNQVLPTQVPPIPTQIPTQIPAQIPLINPSVIILIDFAKLTLAVLPAPGPGSLNNPVWSPDNTQIAFLLKTEQAAYGSLYVADLTGLNARPIGEGAATYEDSLLWSPDGDWLVYSDTLGGIWRIHPDGSQQEQVGTYPAEDGLPFLVWAPTPSGWPLYYRMRPIGPGGVSGAVYVLPGPFAEPIYLTQASYGPMFAGGGQSAGFVLVDGEFGSRRSSIFYLPINPAYLAP